MYNVITSFGNYPTHFRNGKPGPYTEEELGLLWIRHVAAFSEPGMLKRYRLVLLLPRDIVIPDIYNLDLDQWGDKKRVDENNKAQPWPMGPNMTFQQVMWLYHYNKLEGPFLWCEPDCIPVKPSWLDDLFGEYERMKKPFMGHLVDAFVSNGFRTPRHMTGNGIYPHQAYKLAPKILECRGTAWDVYAADQILPKFHDTDLIEHHISDEGEIKKPGPATVLYHPDKSGYLISLSGNGHYEHPPQDSERPLRHATTGEPLVDVFRKEEKREILDDTLNDILLLCQNDKEVQRKVAYFMLDNGIVNAGYWGQHIRKQKKLAEHAESAQ